MDASIVKVLQAVQEEFPPVRPSSSGSRKSPPLAHSSPRSTERNTALPPITSPTTSSTPTTVVPGKTTDPVPSSAANKVDDGSLQYDKQGHQPNSTSTASSSSKRTSPKPTFMELPPKSHMNPHSVGKSSEFGMSMRGSDNLMLTPARDDLTFIFKKKDAPLAAL